MDALGKTGFYEEILQFIRRVTWRMQTINGADGALVKSFNSVKD